jgi:hypothetical protein
MGRFLGKHTSKVQFIMICLVTACLVYVSLSFVKTVHATHYNATVTGYGFGGQGAAGVYMQQWHFANHPPGTMCNGQRDWSGDWAWGTRITMDNYVQLHDSYNNAYYRSNFYLYDNGDGGCSGGMNWADIHHGRYKMYSHSCTCPGTINPSCLVGSNGVNNCTDAVNFGTATRGYTKD